MDDVRALTKIGGRADGLVLPRDLEFHPDRTDELWVADRVLDGHVIYFSAGTGDQTAEEYVDVWGYHFAEELSSMAMGDSTYGDDRTFGTCQESRNTYNDEYAANDFMGPTLWSADLDVYAMVNQDPWGSLLGSHLDMLHASPLCMGIAHDTDNVYWVFDGMNGHVAYYDFAEDHDAGYDDHSDGVIRRYTDAALTRLADVPGHMELDHDTGWLYVADTGAGRVIRLDTNTGKFNQSLRLTNEPLAEHSQYTGATVEVVIEGLGEPSGLALNGDRVFIGDHATGEIIALTGEGEEIGRMETGANGLMGLEFGPEGKLWYVDAVRAEVVRIDPEG